MNKSSNKKKIADSSLRKKKSRFIAKKIFRNKYPKKRRKYIFRKLFAFTLIAGIIFSIVGFITYRSFYNHYESIVQNRMQTGFWQSRAGIYAAPFKINVGQETDLQTVVARLRRAGYVPDDSTDTFWNGSYRINKNSIDITSNTLFDSETETALIEFDDNKVTKISKENNLTASFVIRPEMLTGRSEAKRAGVKALKYEQIPVNLRNAIIITEDRRFFEHNGIDPYGILRALWENINDRRISQGGSTITQQLVKNTFLTNERTFQRKFSEAFLSLALENNMSKEDILTLYCNEIYLGQYGTTGVHGFGMASRVFFEKNIKDISLVEAVSLASMIRRPNHFTLGKNSDELKDRRNLILSLMSKQNLINSEQLEKAKKEKATFAKPKAEIDAIAPYFVDQVSKELPKKVIVDDFDDNLRVYTTINTQLQNIAEITVKDQLDKLEKKFKNKEKKPQATLLAMDPHTGEILAMVGGRDYSETQYNRTIQAKRQPGSVFKPFIYATALEKGLLPSTAFADKQMDFTYDGNKKYKPANYGDFYQNRKITLKTALAKSSNVVEIQTAMRSGLQNVSKKATEFGFENVDPYPSIALGTMEVTSLQLAAAYSSFANTGKKIDPTFIKQIQAGDGSIVYQSKVSDEQIISDETAYMITDMLKAVVDRGTAQSVSESFGEDVVFAGKTGSSKDAWFVGFTPNLVTVAWVGFDDNEDLGLTGGEAALPLWNSFMTKVIKLYPEFGGKNFNKPLGLTSVSIDPETGMLADPNCPHRETVVVPNSARSQVICFRHRVFPEVELAANEVKIKPVEKVESFDKAVANEIIIDKKEKSLKRKVESLENQNNLKFENKANLPEVNQTNKNLTTKEPIIRKQLKRSRIKTKKVKFRKPSRKTRARKTKKFRKTKPVQPIPKITKKPKKITQ